MSLNYQKITIFSKKKVLLTIGHLSLRKTAKSLIQLNKRIIKIKTIKIHQKARWVKIIFLPLKMRKFNETEKSTLNLKILII